MASSARSTWPSVACERGDQASDVGVGAPDLLDERRGPSWGRWPTTRTSGRRRPRRRRGAPSTDRPRTRRACRPSRRSGPGRSCAREALVDPLGELGVDLGGARVAERDPACRRQRPGVLGATDAVPREQQLPELGAGRHWSPGASPPGAHRRGGRTARGSGRARRTPRRWRPVASPPGRPETAASEPRLPWAFVAPSFRSFRVLVLSRPASAGRAVRPIAPVLFVRNSERVTNLVGSISMTARSSSSNRSSWTAVLTSTVASASCVSTSVTRSATAVEPLGQRLLETFHLDADQHRLADRCRHLLLELVELLGVDLVHLLAHRLHPVVDRIETRVEA